MYELSEHVLKKCEDMKTKLTKNVYKNNKKGNTANMRVASMQG